MALPPTTAFNLLWRRIQWERPKIDAWNAWYDDLQPAPELREEEMETAYGRLLALSSENWAGMIVDAPADRLKVVGFRFRGQPADDSPESPWGVWQESGMDAGSDRAILDALISGREPIMVVADAESEVGVRIVPQDPREVAVLYDPGRHVPSERRAAALKTWVDLEGYAHAEIMLPGELVAAKSKQTNIDTPNGWLLQQWGTADGWDWDMSVPGPAEVPVIELHANARTNRAGRSEMAPHVKALQAINLLGFNLMLASEFAAYRQRWVTGLELDIDDDGQPKKPFKSGVDRLFVGEDADTRFGEFSESDLTNFTKVIESKVAMLAQRSKTPAHYVATSISNVSADTIRALESNLVAKCERHQRGLSDSIEDVMRLALSVRGDTLAADSSAEVIWADPRTHTDGQLADSLVKAKTIGVPDEALWERYGASPQEIARWKRMRATDALLAAQVPVSPPVDMAI